MAFLIIDQPAVRTVAGVATSELAEPRKEDSDLVCKICCKFTFFVAFLHHISVVSDK